MSKFKFLLLGVIVITLLMAFRSNRFTKRTIYVANNTNADLTNLSIKSSWACSHSFWKKPKMNTIHIDHLTKGGEAEIKFKGNFNESCYSMRSKTLSYQPIDCITNQKINSKTFKIVISSDSLAGCRVSILK